MRVLSWPARKFRDRNPYPYLLSQSMERCGVEVDEFSSARLLTGRYRIWHLHWPEHFLNSPSDFQAHVKAWALPALMDAAHTLGTKIFWTAHNLNSHERLRPQLEEEFWSRFTRRLDGFFSLSDAALHMVRERHAALRQLPAFVVPHGHYRAEYPATYTRNSARRKLGLQDEWTVILNFGGIRRYKAVPELLRTFRKVQDGSTRLLVAGFCGDEDLKRSIRQEASSDPRVYLFLQAIPSSEVQLYFAAADVVVLPYQTVLNSGAAMLSLSLNTPVYVPALGSIPEIQQTVGTDWVRTYCGEFGRAGLEDAISWARLQRTASPPLDEYEWEGLAAKTIAGYIQILARSN